MGEVTSSASFLAGLLFDLGTVRGQVLNTLENVQPGMPVYELQSSVETLTATVERLTTDNASLRHQLQSALADRDSGVQVMASMRRERQIFEQEYGRMVEMLAATRKEVQMLQIARDAAMSLSPLSYRPPPTPIQVRALDFADVRVMLSLSCHASVTVVSWGHQWGCV